MKLNKTLKFKQIIQCDNIANEFEEDDLRKIAEFCIRNFEADRQSRVDWDRRSIDALKCAKQIPTVLPQPPGEVWRMQIEGKSRSKHNYPLISVFAIQYGSRLYSDFIKNGKVVFCRGIGEDPDGAIADRCSRVSNFMNYQLLDQDKSWQVNFDKQCHITPVLGTTFKNIYWDDLTEENKCDLCLPDEIYVNQRIPSLKEARTITRIIRMYQNDIVERINIGYYRDVKEELFCKSTMSSASIPTPFQDIGQLSSKGSYGEDEENRPITTLKMAVLLDLDDDYYAEPYTVELEYSTKTVLSIRKRWELDRQKIALDNTVISIMPKKEYVDYHCIPAFDGSFMSYGIGQILLPINDAIDTGINMLMDAGAYTSLPSGILSVDYRALKGDSYITPGSFTQSDMTGDELDKSMKPYPVSPPSPVILSLVQLLIQSGKEVGSLTEMTQGTSNVSNAKTGATNAVLQQGLIPYGALVKRTYCPLQEEFQILFDLNSKHINGKQYFVVENTTQAISALDFNTADCDIRPVADPNEGSDVIKMQRAQQLLQFLQIEKVPLTTQAVSKIVELYAKALNVPEDDVKILSTLNTQPTPEAIKTQAETQVIQEKAKSIPFNDQLKAKEVQIDATKVQSDNQHAQMDNAINVAQIHQVEKHHLADNEHERMSHAEKIADIHQKEKHHQEALASSEKIASQKKVSND